MIDSCCVFFFAMSKAKRKDQSSRRIKKKKKKGNMGNSVDKCTSLSKREISRNWLNFIKSTGQVGKLLNVKTICEREAKPCKPKQREPLITKVLALDCEMVSDLDNQNMLARVSLVNFNLECVYDKYVKPTSQVGDYRTRFSGIRKEDLDKGEDFDEVRKEVKELLYNKILVGHALSNDFKVLHFGHHARLIRDTATYSYFKEVMESKHPSLKKLAKKFLNENVQEGEHNSVEDAKTAMKLYKKFRKEWEASFLKPKSKEEQNSQPQEDS